MRWIKGAAALLALVFVGVGTPFALVSWGRLTVWDRPAYAGDGSLVLTLLTLAGWVAWAAFTLMTIGEGIRLCGGHRFVPRLPLLGGLQALSASLVIAVLSLTVSGQGGNTSSEPSRTAAPADPVPHPPGEPARVAPEVSVERVTSPTAKPLSAPGASYVVQAGDDLWGIATRLLGEGTRWRELVKANPEALANPTRPLEPGTSLKLPATTAGPVSAPVSAPAPASLPVPGQLTVRKGDTLSALAEEHLGRASLWPRIAAANRDLISNPDHIEVGWRLTLPAQAQAAVTEAASPAERAGEGEVAGEGQPVSTSDSHPAGEAGGETGGGATETSSEVGDASRDAADPLDASRQATDSPDISRETTEIEDAEARDVSRDIWEAGEAQQEAADSPDGALIGSVGALAAAGLVGGWEARRLMQSRSRSPGRRVQHPDEELARFRAALGRRQEPDHGKGLEAALRAISRHCHAAGVLLPELAQVVATAATLRFEWAEPAGPPPLGFAGDRKCWVVDLTCGDPAVASHPCAYPALVSLGTTENGETVMVDLEHSRVLGVTAASSELRLASLASMAVELGCAPWAAEVALTVVGVHAGFAAIAGGGAVTQVPLVDDGLELFRRRYRARSAALAELDLRRLRVDPERAEAVAPEVFVFHDPVDASTRAELDSLLATRPVGMAVVLATEDDSDADWRLFGDPWRPSGSFGAARPGVTAELAAHAIPAGTRAAVESLYRLAESEHTEPAPWWSEPVTPNRPHPVEIRRQDPVEIVSLRHLEPTQPVLLLIGPVDLVGAGGSEPTRSRTQLIELCSWVLEYPGRTATQMAAGLGIAESTRRSNMSRLRSWLGVDAAGQPYLPDAYSGRIRLHPDVTSDARQLGLLAAPGVNRLDEPALTAVLDLVRGDILADAAPGQWFWAEELRSDVAATVRDAGLVLVDKALAGGRMDLARWAAERALVVVPDDELLACARIRTEHAAGNRTGVQRLVGRLVQRARALGLDLRPETVLLCQQVIEGRSREVRLVNSPAARWTAI